MATAKSTATTPASKPKKEKPPKRREGLTGQGSTFGKKPSQCIASEELSDQQVKFCEEWLLDHNASRAAKAAGYSPRTAGQIGCGLLKNPKISQYLEPRKAERLARLSLTTDNILREASRIAFFDIRKLLNEDGSPKPMQELDDDTAAAVAGLDITEEWEGKGEDRRFVGWTKKYKISDKNVALDKLMRHAGLLKDKLEVTGKDGGALELSDPQGADLIKAARRIAFALTKAMVVADKAPQGKPSK